MGRDQEKKNRSSLDVTTTKQTLEGKARNKIKIEKFGTNQGNN